MPHAAQCGGKKNAPGHWQSGSALNASAGSQWAITAGRSGRAWVAPGPQPSAPDTVSGPLSPSRRTPTPPDATNKRENGSDDANSVPRFPPASIVVPSGHGGFEFDSVRPTSGTAGADESGLVVVPFNQSAGRAWNAIKHVCHPEPMRRTAQGL